MDNIIRLVNVNRIYGTKTKVHVLHDIDLNVEAGSFNAIIGDSGSGKTTLLNLIGTLDKPTSGEIYIDGKRTDSMNQRKLVNLRNQKIGFVFQFHYLLSEFTAIENILMPYKIQHFWTSKKIYKRAEEMLEWMGIRQFKNSNVSDLSGGQQQRVAIARALINEPKIILADEPTGNLDSKSTQKIYEIFREINKTLGTTFIIITHDEKIAQKADRRMKIEDGKIVI